LTVLPDKVNGIAPSAMTGAHLQRLAREALDRRDAEYEKLKTPQQCADYQQRLRAFFLQRLGPFPERTPLNPQVSGRESRDGYRVEKVLFESQPGFHVTGIMYLPDGPPPYPAVLVPCGHSENGKAAEAYQRASIILAKNGLAAFCFDPVGQGERKQILDAQGKGPYRATSEHALEAPAAILIGRNLATTMVWDGMRAIDYLQSRPDVDPKRIGCAGNSGGGTQTAYLMALDERIVSAAPNCYITSFRRLLETIGPQDPEQNIFGQVGFGLDHADYLILRAPRPTLIGAATRDFFDIAGTWSSFRQAKRVYTRLGFPERMELVEADTEHGWGREIREGTARWMRRWLLDKDEPVSETDFPIAADEQLRCSPKGQVILMPGERTIFDLYRDQERRLADGRKRLWQDRAKALAEVRRLSGIRPLAELPPIVSQETGAVQRDGYRIRKATLEVEDGLVLPALGFTPAEPKGDVYLYLHGAGKDADAGPGGPMEKLVREGLPVMAVDLRGLGELQARNNRGEPQGTSGKDVATAYLLGKSYLEMRAEDTLRCARLLADALRSRGLQPRIHLVAVGEAGPPALHAAALEPDMFASVKLFRSLRSWVDVVRTPVTVNQRVNVVHGALTAYDLPDLVAVLGDKVTVVEPADAR